VLLCGTPLIAALDVDFLKLDIGPLSTIDFGERTASLFLKIEGIFLYPGS